MSTTLGQIVQLIEEYYPTELAQNWDRVGLIVGNRADRVQKILVAVDPVEEVVTEAIECGANLLLTHHPLFLRGTSSVSTDTSKGRVVHRLIQANCALMAAHTNADAAFNGVADCLADLAQLRNRTVLEPHPLDPEIGIGRVGVLPAPMTLADFAKALTARLPASPAGVLVGGELLATVEKIAVSGGSGDSLLDLARQSGADVFVTADLRHHPASEHLAEGKPYLVCPTHWASEWPWVGRVCKQLQTESDKLNLNLEVKASKIVTEPWTAHFSSERTIN